MSDMSTLLETNAWLRIPGRGSATIPMSYVDYLDLDEPVHVEYYDGCAVVNNPNRVHQRVIARVLALLNQACPVEYEALAEWGWEAAAQTMFKPDVMVVAKEGPQDWLRTAPLIAVEVLSPSTRRVDLTLKMEAYAAGGALWYWVVDPVAQSVSVYANRAGRFVQHRLDSTAHKATAMVITDPFPVTIDVTELLA